MSLESPPTPPSEGDGVKLDFPDVSSKKLENIRSQSMTLAASSLTPSDVKTKRSLIHRYGRVLLGLSIFAVASGGILLVAHLKMAGDMAGHDMSGHDMSGMSHDDMMQVNGAFNPIPVTVEEVEQGAFEAGVSYTGSIAPYQEAVVYPRVAGQLANYSVYPGDRVGAGQTLARLIADERTTELDEAKAEVEAMATSLKASQAEIDEQKQEIARLQAELDYQKLQKGRFALLTAEGATSQNQYDIAATEVATTEAALKGAQAKLARLQARVQQERAEVGRARAKVNTAAVMKGYTVLQAPISGIVQTRMVDPGVVVQPGMGILKIGDYSRVRLQANVAQKDAGYIQVGTPIRARVPGAMDADLEGRVTSIFPQTNRETRTVTVEAVVDNPQNRLLSGQFLEMTLMTGRKLSTLSIPQTAVVEFNGETSVWVVEGDAARRRGVKTGITNGDRIEITRGLDPGDRVITSGHSRLVPDVKVAIADESGGLVPMLGDGNQGDIEAAVVTPDPARGFKSGGAELILEVRDPETQEPLAVKDVAVDVTMPMPNMAPMTTMVQLEAADEPGQFQVKTHFGMTGDWHIQVEVKDSDRKGRTTIVVPVK